MGRTTLVAQITNFLATALEGSIACGATAVHLGRTTQVWDAEVRNEASG
jgi:acyl-coenzyme A thioesterase PaaI-like protein